MGLLSCERQHTSKQFFIFRAYQRNVRELWMVPWASGKVIQRKCFQSLPACLASHSARGDCILWRLWVGLGNQIWRHSGEETFILERSGDLNTSNHIPQDSQGQSLSNSLTWQCGSTLSVCCWPAQLCLPAWCEHVQTPCAFGAPGSHSWSSWQSCLGSNSWRGGFWSKLY